MHSGTDLHTATRNLDHATGREVSVGGRSYLFFGGTAYLGLNMLPGFMELFSAGMHRYGVNNGTSRTNNVQIGIYNEAERHAATTFGFEDAILMSSGFLAAQLAVGSGSGVERPLVIHSPCCHPAIWRDGKPAITAFGTPGGPVNFRNWVAQTIERINNDVSDQVMVISNTLDNIIPERFDFSTFATQIDPRKQVHFILDDSHGLGVFDPSQTSVHGQFANAGPNIKLTVVSSMAKGMGIDTGLILGDLETLKLLRQTGTYIGASPSAPAFLYAYLRGADIYQQQWKKLQDNICYFSENLPENWRSIPGYPVFYCPQPGLYEALLSRKILISSFPYPNPEDPPVSRIVVNASHRKKDLDELIFSLRHLKYS